LDTLITAYYQEFGPLKILLIVFGHPNPKQEFIDVK